MIPARIVAGCHEQAHAGGDLVTGDERGDELAPRCAAALREREQRGQTVETRFVSIDAADITHAEMRGRTEQVTVKFVSQLVSVTRDRGGAVVDGNPDKVRHAPAVIRAYLGEDDEAVTKAAPSSHAAGLA